MVEWRWQCKYCGEMLNTANGVGLHVFTKHNQAALHALPVAVDEWVVQKKKAAKKVRKALEKEPEQEPTEEIGLLDDLSLPPI
jgi:hypothetical protein